MPNKLRAPDFLVEIQGFKQAQSVLVAIGTDEICCHFVKEPS
jgi:hypothetical protein